MKDWISDRAALFEASGIRKVFDLAASMKDPINLSIGQPDFDVPAEVQQACVEAIHGRRNAYSQTQGIGPLRQRLSDDLRSRYGHSDRDVLITSGTSGGLVIAMLTLINPGDEVIFFDPYFVMYPALVKMAGGVPVIIDSAPDFQVDVQKVADAITPRTKLILLNSPNNPTGISANQQQIQDLALLAQQRGVVLISDEIYSQFQYDEPFVSPAQFNEQTIVIDGFSKSHAMTGWRVGYLHGPAELLAPMARIQQFTYVCAPQPAQWGALKALDIDLSHHIDEYRRKRDLICDGLAGYYELTRPTGAFYAFPKVPSGSGTDFVTRAIANELLIIPGNIFSAHDTHFRISYAASDEMLQRGIEVLQRLAK